MKQIFGLLKSRKCHCFVKIPHYMSFIFKTLHQQTGATNIFRVWVGVFVTENQRNFTEHFLKRVYLKVFLLILSLCLCDNRFGYRFMKVDHKKLLFNRRGRNREMQSNIISRYLQLKEIAFFSCSLTEPFHDTYQLQGLRSKYRSQYGFWKLGVPCNKRCSVTVLIPSPVKILLCPSQTHLPKLH